jgi:hypothetical protein
MNSNANPLSYYAEQSSFSDLSGNVLGDVNAKTQLEEKLEGILFFLHEHLVHETELSLFPEKNHNRQEMVLDVSLRTALEMMNSLAHKRKTQPQSPLFVNCRNVALLACGLLRAFQIPSRLRAGFMTYAYAGSKFKLDHVVLEYWHAEKNKWILMDPFLPNRIREKKRTREGFEPCDLQSQDFLLAADAWEFCQTFPQASDEFGCGIFKQDRGLFVVRNKMMLDFAYLNKCEASPFDLWGYMILNGPHSSPQNVKQISDLNHLSAILRKGEFNSIQDLWLQNPFLKAPSIVISDYPKGHPQCLFLPQD